MSAVESRPDKPPAEPSCDPLTVLARDPAAVTRRLGNQTVILPVRQGVPDPVAVYSLNETGSFIWDRCDGVTEVGAIVQALLEAFAVEPSQAWRDAAALIADLRVEGLLLERPAATAEPSGTGTP